MYQTPTHPYIVPKTGRSTPALVLAIAMHCLLGAMLFFGLRWQSRAPDVISAELWSALPQVAAPAPQPVPTPRVQAPVPPPLPKEVEPPPPPPPRADIVVREEAPRVVPPKKVVTPPPPTVVKPEPKPVPVVQPKPEVKAPPAPDLRYEMSQANAAPATGSDRQTSSPGGSDRYKAAIAAKIRSNTRFPAPPGVTGNPTVVMRIEQLPSGEVTDVKIVSTSGLAPFDQAVQRAVEASSPLPKDEQGRVTTPLQLEYRLFPDRQ